MTKEEFKKRRKRLNKTQKELAVLLGISIKTVHSYEQGWRSIPSHIEKMLYFLLAHYRHNQTSPPPCWEQTDCSCKEECPAWEFNIGSLCWFINGTLCDKLIGIKGEREKLEICKQCTILTNILEI